MCRTAVDTYTNVAALWLSLLMLMITNRKDLDELQAALKEAQEHVSKKVIIFMLHTKILMGICCCIYVLKQFGDNLLGISLHLGRLT